MLMRKVFFAMSMLLLVGHREVAGAQTTKLVVAYASPAATFCPGWIAKKEGIFSKYGLDVEMVLMQGASMYMPALTSGNIQVLYGGGTAVSRAIATGGFDLTVIATETRYVPLRLMVNPAIQSPSQLKEKKLGAGQAGPRRICDDSLSRKNRFGAEQRRSACVPCRWCAEPCGGNETGFNRRRRGQSAERVRARESGISRTRQFSGP